MSLDPGVSSEHSWLWLINKNSNNSNKEGKELARKTHRHESNPEEVSSKLNKTYRQWLLFREILSWAKFGRLKKPHCAQKDNRPLDTNLQEVLQFTAFGDASQWISSYQVLLKRKPRCVSLWLIRLIPGKIPLCQPLRVYFYRECHPGILLLQQINLTSFLEGVMSGFIPIGICVKEYH